MKTAAILFLLVSLSLAAHSCIHDTLDVPLQHIDDQGPEDSTPSDSNNRVLAGTYQSIRIYADYTHLTVGNSVVKEYIQNQLVASAISYYQKTLSVVRTTSNITYTDPCGGLSAPSYLRTTGVDADLVILVTAEYSSESYLAYAMPCALARSNDRPVYGMININYNGLTTATNANLEENLITVIHEMAHVLGFSSNLYGFWKTTDGTYPNQTTTVNGQTFTYLKAEPLRTKVRNYFGCTNAIGAYLENEGDSGSAGSHFERRVFFNEFMTASSITDSVISDFTLALFESTGWYSVVYSDATSQNYEPFAWGKNRGCNFLNGVCMTSSTTTSFPEEFCTPLQKQGCTFTARAVGVCGTSSTVYYDPTLPSQFNYYGNNTIVLDSFSDNCPYYLGYPNGDCEDATSSKVLADEVYGTKSRCFSGTLTNNASPRTRTGFCFPTTCSSSNGATIVTIKIGSTTITCTAAGTQSVTGYANGVIECPDPATFCAKANPVYCERGCSGRGTCTNGVCSCPTGWGGSDCGLRIYADGDSRCASESSKTSWFGNACACNPSTGNCTTALIGSGDGGVTRQNDYVAAGAALGNAFGVILLAILALA